MSVVDGWLGLCVSFFDSFLDIILVGSQIVVAGKIGLSELGLAILCRANVRYAEKTGWPTLQGPMIGKAAKQPLPRSTGKIAKI